jgi:hypothetical protein
MFLPVCMLLYSTTNLCRQNFSPCWPITPHARSSAITSYKFIHFKLTYDFIVFIFFLFLFHEYHLLFLCLDMCVCVCVCINNYFNLKSLNLVHFGIKSLLSHLYVLCFTYLFIFSVTFRKIISAYNKGHPTTFPASQEYNFTFTL